MLKPLSLIPLAISISACLAVPFSAPANAQEPSKIDLHTTARKPSKYPVFFVTDRAVKREKDKLVFTTDRAQDMTYGEFHSGLEPEVKLNSKNLQVHDSEATFAEALQKTGAKRVAVFVHGYRKSFEGSLDFAQRIASELDVPVVLFAWPSKNKYSAYMVDECTAEWSSYQLAPVLHDLDKQFGAQNVSLISHSLGSRVVDWSLRLLATQKQLTTPFGCNIMFSPDVDRDTFLAESPFIRSACSRVKVYLDSHDTRLWLSKVLHGSPRLGTIHTAAENELLSSMFEFDTSMPSHHIPYTLMSSAMSNAVAVPVTETPGIRN